MCSAFIACRSREAAQQLSSKHVSMPQNCVAAVDRHLTIQLSHSSRRVNRVEVRTTRNDQLELQ